MRMGDLLLLEWMHVWTPLLRQRKKWKKHFEVSWQIPLVLRLFDVPHPGKLRLRQGRWNLSELDSASSDGTSSCRASLVSVLSLHTCVHVSVQPHSHPHTCAHRLAYRLRFCMHLLLSLPHNAHYSSYFPCAGQQNYQITKRLLC